MHITRQGAALYAGLWAGRFVGVLIDVFEMALPFSFMPQWYLDWLGLPSWPM